MAHTHNSPRQDPAHHDPGRRPRRRHSPRTCRDRNQVHGARVQDGAIPGTVWDCGAQPTDPDARFPVPIVERVTTSFSTPGDQVVLLTTGGPSPDRHPVTPRVLANRVTAAAAAVERLDQRCRITHARDERSGRYRERPGADLVIASVPPRETIDEQSGHAWTSLLRPGGILAVLTHSGDHAGRFVDPTGSIVTTARHAGLRYLQHIVTLQAQVRDGALAVHPVRQCRPGVLHRGDGPRRHVRVHADVLVFARPAQPAANENGER